MAADADTPSSIPACDAALLKALAEYHWHLGTGDLTEADKDCRRMDELPEVRFHLPQQHSS